MQHGYGMAETHQQQFMEGDSCSSFSSISSSQKQNQHHHLRNHHYHHHLHPPPPPEPKHERRQQPQQQFFQFHPVPFTQQLLQQQHHHHQFEAFRLHQQLRLESELGGNGGRGGDGGNCHGPSSLPFFDFKLGLNENSGNRSEGEEDGGGGGGGLIGGDEEHIPGSRPNSLEIPQCCWHSQEDGTIKEPFWKPLNTQLFMNKNDKESSEEEKESTDKKISDGGKNLGNKYRFFGELEAICGGAGLGQTNQTGSGSALTGENLLRPPLAGPQCGNFAAAAAAATGVDHGSETSIGEEASLRKLQKRKRRRKMKEDMNSMAGFLGSLVKQLMDHQEGLYRKFLEVVDRIDQERIEREESWRTQQIQSFNEEATARAKEQALASSRELAIVSYLEKITGKKLHMQDTNNENNNSNTQLHCQQINSFAGGNTTNGRWPKAEVEALIRVRSRLESRFQEPGLKGPLWEEISTSMASMGYERSAKRCKEKWENINKYFRKTKHCNKKRSHQSKTCPYFDQLDQLYSRPPLYHNPSASTTVVVRNLKGNSELLDAIVAVNDAHKVAPMESFEDKAEADHGDEKENDNDNEEVEEEEEDDEEECGGGDGNEEDGD